MPTGCELGIDPALGDCGTPLVQPGSLGTAEVGRHVGKSRAAPDVERLPQHLRRCGRVGGQPALAPAASRSNSSDVEADIVRNQAIAAIHGLDEVAAEFDRAAPMRALAARGPRSAAARHPRVPRPIGLPGERIRPRARAPPAASAPGRPGSTRTRPMNVTVIGPRRRISSCWFTWTGGSPPRDCGPIGVRLRRAITNGLRSVDRRLTGR